MFKNIIVGLLAVAAVPAFAQDAAPAFNGFYIGAQGGWQQDRQNLNISGTSSTAKSDGFAYGGQAGYDFRLGNTAVLGAEVSATGRTGTARFDGFDLRQGRTLNATARLGFVASPTMLIYARAGYSNARFTVDDGTARASENRGGYTVGGGVEQSLGHNVSARLEYAYSDFGSDNLSAQFGTSTELKYRRHAVTAGLNYRF